MLNRKGGVLHDHFLEGKVMMNWQLKIGIFVNLEMISQWPIPMNLLPSANFHTVS